MKKVACYVRVSTENQLENYSIEEQTSRLKAYCVAKDYSIHKIYTDGGYSGGNTNRPALMSMLDDVHKHLFDSVIVYKLDRLSRSQKDTLTLIEDEFLVHDIDFVSVCENFDTSTPFGRAMIGILSVFAQLEKDQITERFTMGRIGRCKAGYFHGGGNAPKGYRYIDGILQVDLLEAEQVRNVYTLFASGKSINAISKIMTENYGNSNWNSASKISNCLKNSIYIGKVKFKGQEHHGMHEPIINEDLYQQVNAMLTSDEREAKKTTPQKTPFRAGYMLSSMIYCKRCGARYSANHGYYKCYSRSKSSKKFIADPNCMNDNWIIQDLDNAVTNEILKLKMSEEYKKNIVKSDNLDKPKIKSEIKKIDIQIEKILDLYQISDIPISSIKQKIEKLNRQKNELQKMADSEIDVSTAIENFEMYLNRFVKIYNTAGVPEKRVVISNLIDKIEVDGRKIFISWRL